MWRYLIWVELPLCALEIGDTAPDFFLPDQQGYVHTLREHRGEFVLLFFYPRDFTPHSSQVVRAFEKTYPEIRKKRVAVYGISNDFVKTHANFHKAFKLTYDLLADPEEVILKKYNAVNWLETKFISYLIGPDGRVFRKYDTSAAIKHPTLILADLR